MKESALHRRLIRTGAVAVAAAVLAACAGTVTTPAVRPSTAPPVPLLEVRVQGTLHDVGNVVLAAAQQGSYSGPFTYRSSNHAVLALSLAPPPDTAHRHALAPRGKEKLVSPDGHAYVIAIGAGAASISVEGEDQVVATPAKLHVTIRKPSSVTVMPSNLDFTATGPSEAKHVLVRQDSYAGPFAESDTCSGIATIAAVDTLRGRVTYAVTPVGAGNCKATFSGGGGQTAALTISVVLGGKVVLSPPSLTFTGTGASSAQSVDVSQEHYYGTFRERGNCAHIVKIVLGNHPVSGVLAEYIVTPLGAGSCHATITGGGRQSAILPISVVLPVGGRPQKST